MDNNATSQTAEKLIDRLKFLAIPAVFLSAISLAAAALWPIQTHVRGRAESTHTELGSLTPAPRDVRGILNEIVGRTLIRPGQVKAAVKKTGAAERLAKQLTLHGIITMPDGPSAYIAVANQGVVDVRAGEQILEFTVKQIDPGAVILSLDGEEVQLRN